MTVHPPLPTSTHFFFNIHTIVSHAGDDIEIGACILSNDNVSKEHFASTFSFSVH
jgi:hypothetical protein